MLKQATIAGAMIVCLGPFAARAEAPDLQSGTPVIYLADNLDEKDKLGWCIDTKGRGFADTLHAHSCKPAGPGYRDTQFSYDADSGQIRSAAFDEKWGIIYQSTPFQSDYSFALRLPVMVGAPTVKEAWSIPSAFATICCCSSSDRPCMSRIISFSSSTAVCNMRI